ncbi:hypothetical protein HWV62_34783 [Athelia sp. TMB]|nr:hypothetical protein HWV62_34783 [Athelia sp. TMB]
MASSGDEYDAFNLDDFTEDDFANIDKNILVDSPATLPHQARKPAGGPALTIEVEEPADDVDAKESSGGGPLRLSPYSQFRSWNNALSVSDLVAPAWYTPPYSCEVQYDYGLRQMRFKKLEHRPSSFTTSEGKNITVKKQVAAKNDVRLKHGQSVHKVLEKEIRPVEIQVEIATEEERWALRLVNMISGLQSLMEMGCMREMPVFGIIQDQLVIGVIDELLRQPMLPSAADTSVSNKRHTESMHATPKSKKTRQEPSPSQTNITSFFPVSPARDKEEKAMDERPMTPPPAPTSASRPLRAGYTLHLLDTKSRKSRSLPEDSDTKSSRLQLMLYHRLLSALICNDFDFDSLWKRLKLNPLKQLSARFQAQSGLIFSGDGPRLNCLDGLVQMWNSNVRLLDIGGIDPTLVLVYRFQPQVKRKKKWAGRKRTGDISQSIVSQEESDIARAIAESMQDIAGVSATGGNEIDDDLAAAIAESLKQPAITVPSFSDEGSNTGVLTGGTSPDGTVSDGVAEDPDVLLVLQQSLVDRLGAKEETLDAVDNTSDSSSDFKNSGELMIIGTKDFKMDDIFLDAYLTDILQWWHGKRQPKGVEEILVSTWMDANGGRRRRKKQLVSMKIDERFKMLLNR